MNIILFVTHFVKSKVFTAFNYTFKDSCIMYFARLRLVAPVPF